MMRGPPAVRWLVPLVVAGLIGVGASTAQDAARGTPREPDAASVVACDGLVALRQLTAAAPDPADARGQVSAHPGCRVLDRASLGAVERRAMIGGAPFECLTPTGGGACLWVMP